MDPKIIKSTQDSLGKLIKKPPLTDKLLSKPPFRFLHDIMTSVIKTTGFMKGLYTDSEMNSDNVKDKDSKMGFLQKAVDMVSLVLGSQLSVRPSKVVAGHEPEKTNEFLQALAAAVNKNVNSENYVQRVLNGDRSGKEPKTKEERREKDRDRSRDKEDHNDRKSREKSSDRRKEEKESRDKDERRERSRDKERGREERERHRDKDRERDRDKDQDREKDRDRDKGRDREKDSSREKDRDRDRNREREKDRDRHRDRDQRDKEREHKSRKEDMSGTPSPGTSASFDRKIGIKSRLKSRPPGENVLAVASKESKISGQQSRQKSNASVTEKHSSSSIAEHRNSKSSIQQRERQASTHDFGKDKGLRKTGSRTSSQHKPPESIEDLSSGNNSHKQPIGKQRKSAFNMLVVEQPECDAEHRREEAQKENESPDLETPRLNGEAEVTDPPPKKAERPASAKGSRRRRDGTLIDSSDEEDMPPSQMKQETSRDGTLGEDHLPPQVAETRKMARPSSARPAAPRVKNKDAVADEPSMRLGSGKPTNVIVDNDQSDDDDNFMVEESAPPPMTIEREKTMLGLENDEEHGGLVKKILESKKEFEGGNQQAASPQKKTEIERPTMSDAARRKEREMVQKEIDKLRGSIQTVTRSANPLGKIMDYVQEDLDAMQKELDVWKKENREQSLALKREQSITDKAIEPLKAQLSEIDQAILDQMDLIAAVKSNIIHNDQKIEKMLRSISKS